MIIPAIDLREGKCVRLYQGKLENTTIYAENPVAVAEEWAAKGAQYLHLVDLDGAFAGSPQNLQVVREIVQKVEIPVQLGGGIRDKETIDRLLGEGIARVILGTSAVTNPGLIAAACTAYGARIVLGIDARDGLVAIQGWEQQSGKDYVQLALEMKEIGIQRVIFTDTKLDGTLQGPNLDSTRTLAETSGLKVLASGGVAGLNDLQALLQLEKCGVEGVILGKALYTGRIKLEEALALAQERADLPC